MLWRMRGEVLIIIGLVVNLYTAIEQLRSRTFVNKPLGFAIGSGLILWGFAERRKNQRLTDDGGDD